MAKKLYTESYIEDIADAIRENISSQDTFTVSEMAHEIEEIGGDCYDGILNGDGVRVYNPRATALKNRVLQDMNSLASVDLPEVLSIGKYSLAYNSYMESVSIPKCTTVEEQAFLNAGASSSDGMSVNMPAVTTFNGNSTFEGSGIVEADFPNLATASGQKAFYNCKKMTSLDIPLVQTVGNQWVQGCDHLINLSMANLETAGTECFRGCSRLVNVNLPKLQTTGSGYFRGDGALVEVTLPSVVTFSGSTFYQCGNLEYVDLPSCEEITSGTFYSSNKVYAFILRYTGGVVPLAQSDLFASNSKIRQGTGYIYVPSALIESYKIATNWSTYYADAFRALESYTVDGTTTGALDPEKI